MNGSRDPWYTERLLATESGWKARLGVQLPYRWHIRRRVTGRVLDIGCGVGRNLTHLGGTGVGIDTNSSSVWAARERGLVAYLPEEFAASPDALPSGYDTLLFAHVLEHMERQDASGLIAQYLPFLRPIGHVLIIVPQEVGFRSDPTHVEFVSAEAIRQMASANSLEVERVYSFPFPRWVGRFFRYNETVGLLRRPTTAPT